MLYFSFVTDKFVAPQKRVTVIPYENGKAQPTLLHEENVEICLGEIEHYFFKKLREELKLIIKGSANALYDVIGVPINAFNIDDENTDGFDEIVKFVLLEYSHYPIRELGNRSLQDLSIGIKFCKKIKNSELNKMLSEYMQSKNYESVEEQILWKNMTDNEKTDTFSEKLRQIGSDNNELIIVDPYLFSTSDSVYCELLSNIIKKSNSKPVVVITDDRHYTAESFQLVQSNVSASIELKFSSDFHDRFWIVDRINGICSGTSLNGVGKRISLLNEISEEDVKDIVEELSDKNLI